MAQCPHGHTMPDELITHFLNSPDSQAGLGRHKCAICAYALGIAYIGNPTATESCAHGNLAPVELLSDLPWYQGKPLRHKCATCAFIEGVAHGTANVAIDVSAVTEDGEQDNQGTVEGVPILRLHRTYERDPRNRVKAIVYHGNRCFGCGFSFDDTYTTAHATGYIEIHHILPLAAGPRIVNPYLELIPLCANCHRMVHHHANDWLGLEELRQLIAEAKGKLGHTAP